MKRLLGLCVAAAIIAIVYTNCSSSMEGNGVGGAQGTTYLTPISGNNVMSVTLGGYGNEPYVSITVCQHGTTNCYQIDNLLLDSGSSGIRIFSNNLPLSWVTGAAKGECQTYIDGTIDWGPVVNVDVVLGGETASNVPIQLIDNNYADSGAKCYNDDVAWLNYNGYPDSGCSYSNQANGCPFFDAPTASYSGIIGVNFLLQDCGEACATTLSNDQTFVNPYYSCSGATCTSYEMPLTSQVSNPIGFLPAPDNNGLMIQMPNTSMDNDLQAYAVLGIGTQANNQPSGVTTLTADPNDSDTNYTLMTTSWQGQTIASFLDTGSNTLTFPYENTVNTLVAGYPVMPVDYNTNAFTPASPASLSATNIGYNGAQSTVNFLVENVENDFSSYDVVNYIGVLDGNGPINGEFDWGLPFFLGRTVFIGLENQTSTLGSGLYWAY